MAGSRTPAYCARTAFPIVGLMRRIGPHVQTGVAGLALQRFDHGADGRLADVLPESASIATVDRVDPGFGGGKDRGAMAMPAVSWVWKWIGRSDFFLQSACDQRARRRWVSASRPCPSDLGRGRPPPPTPWPWRRSTSGRTWIDPGPSCRRCSTGSPRSTLPLSSTASIATRMLSTQFRRVEHAEDVHARLRRLTCVKLTHDVVRVVGVSDPICRPQQHLRHDVGHRFAQRPGAGATDHSCKKRYATSKVAPPQHSTDRSPGSFVRIGRCAPATMSIGAHPGREQRLVSVAHGRVGDQQTVLRAASIRRRRAGPSLFKDLCASPPGGVLGPGAFGRHLGARASAAGLGPSLLFRGAR